MIQSIAEWPPATLGLLWLWGCIAVGLVMFVIVLCRCETWRK